MVIMARTEVEDMYLVLLLMARVLRRLRIKRGKGRRKADEVKMVDKQRMVRSMGTEAKARRTTVKGRPDKKDKVTEGSDNHNPTT